MAKIIEIIGPSGIGKSFLYNKIRENWNEGKSWAAYHDYRYKRKQSHSMSINEKVLQLYFKVFEKYKYYAYIKNGGEKLYNLKNAHIKNEKFINKTFDIINDCCAEAYNGKDNRYLTTIYFLKSLEEVQAIRDIKHDARKCIFDEGLINRIMHLNTPEFTNKTLIDFLEHMPLPDGLVILKSDIDQIIQNINNRKRIATIHQGLNETQIYQYTLSTQRLMESAAIYMKSIGVNVQEYHINRDDSVVIPEILNIIERF